MSFDNEFFDYKKAKKKQHLKQKHLRDTKRSTRTLDNQKLHPSKTSELYKSKEFVIEDIWDINV